MSLQILKRAKGESGEIVDWNEGESNIKEEVNRRTYKAGYTNREGGPPATGKIQISVPFGKVKLNIWPRDNERNLIDD